MRHDLEFGQESEQRVRILKDYEKTDGQEEHQDKLKNQVRPENRRLPHPRRSLSEEYSYG